MFHCAIRDCGHKIPHVTRFVPLPPDGARLRMSQSCDLDALRKHLVEAHGTRPSLALLPRYHRLVAS